MHTLVEECPCHDIFQCDPKLSCLAPVEADLYASKIPLMATASFIRDIRLCAICAGKSNDVDGGRKDRSCDALKTVYAMVLPICDTCKNRGETTLVGRNTNNGKAIQQLFDQNLRFIVVASTRNQLGASREESI